MTGKRYVRYDHSPFFYSDLFDLSHEAVGELDADLETVADWQEAFCKGVVYYLREGRVRSVLLWNVTIEDTDSHRFSQIIHLDFELNLCLSVEICVLQRMWTEFANVQ